MKTPTTVLLVVIAALLAANLFVNLPPREATAQPHLKADAPHVIQVVQGPAFDPRIYRLWSDGVIEEALFGSVNWACEPISPGFGWQVIPEPPLGVRITRIYAGVPSDEHNPSSPLTLMRLRSDGVVEQNRLGGNVWCGWLTPPE